MKTRRKAAMIAAFRRVFFFNTIEVIPNAKISAECQNVLNRAIVQFGSSLSFLNMLIRILK